MNPQAPLIKVCLLGCGVNDAREASGAVHNDGKSQRGATVAVSSGLGGINVVSGDSGGGAGESAGQSYRVDTSPGEILPGGEMERDRISVNPERSLLESRSRCHR